MIIELCAKSAAHCPFQKFFMECVIGNVMPIPDLAGFLQLAQRDDVSSGR